MRCVYPNGVELTKEQIEAVSNVVERLSKMIDYIQETFEAVWEWLRSLVRSDGFQEVLKHVEREIKPINKFPKLPQVQLPEIPPLDKRSRMHNIRSNC